MSSSRVWKIAVFSVGALLCAYPAAHAATEGGPTQEQQAQQQDDRGQAKEQAGGEKSKSPDAARAEEAKEGDNDRESRRERMRKRMEAALFKGIELTDEQRATLDRLREESRAANTAWREEHKEELETIRRALHEARQEDDKEKAEAARQRLRELFADAPERGRINEYVKGVLTEEQQAVFDANYQAWRDEMRKRWERRREGESNGDGDAQPQKQEQKQEQEPPREQDAADGTHVS